MIDKNEFIADLTSFVKKEIERCGDLEYCNEAIEISDARNGIFKNIGIHSTDEENDIIRIKELCMMNEQMDFEPNIMKIKSIARFYFD